MQQPDNTSVSTHLGKTSTYKSQYDPSLLVREPRANNRLYLGIEDSNLPFKGTDTWNAYEISALTNNGLPVTCIGKIVYPCSSKYIVESKSLKLYLNSFNMSHLGKTPADVLVEINRLIAKDLSALLETEVKVGIHSDKKVAAFSAESSKEYNEDPCIGDYITLEDNYPIEDIEFSVYTETPELIRVIEPVVHRCKYHSALLKSNCRVTQQPDWGDIFIEIESKYSTVDPISLLEYIVSFRDECHFHEEIVECIYKRIWNALNPEKLHVYALYARRGGIDINPERYSHEDMAHGILSDETFIHVKTPKQ